MSASFVFVFFYLTGHQCHLQTLLFVQLFFEVPEEDIVSVTHLLQHQRKEPSSSWFQAQRDPDPWPCSWPLTLTLTLLLTLTPTLTLLLTRTLIPNLTLTLLQCASSGFKGKEATTNLALRHQQYYFPPAPLWPWGCQPAGGGTLGVQMLWLELMLICWDLMLICWDLWQRCDAPSVCQHRCNSAACTLRYSSTNWRTETSCSQQLDLHTAKHVVKYCRCH